MTEPIIKFTENVNWFNIAFFAVATGIISLRFFSSPITQFVTTTLMVILELFIFTEANFEIKKLNRFFFFFQIIKVALLFYKNLREVFALFTAVSIIFLIFSRLNKNKKYYLAFLAHIADLITTELALGKFKEANIFLKGLMNLIGTNLALLIVKLFLIGTMLVYIWREFDGELELFLLKAVTFLGFAMASRNAYLILVS